MKRLLFTAVACLALFPRAAAAQCDTGAPPLEVGVSAGLVSSGGSRALFLGGPRAAVNLGCAAVEFGADTWAGRSRGYGSFQGTYYVAGRYWLGETDSGFRLYATFGGMGMFSRDYVVRFDAQHERSARKTWRLEGLSGVVGGLAVDRPLNAHVAFRAAAEAFFLSGGVLAPKFTTGLSLAIGRYDR